MAILTQTSADPAPPIQADDSQRSEIRQHLALAATATGLTVAAQLLYAPLQMVALPLLISLGVRPGRRAYAAWQEERRLSVDVAETAALALFILPGNLLIGSLAFSVYHLGQWIAISGGERSQPQPPSAPVTWVRHLSDQREVLRPLNAICDGDTIVVETGELIPLPGTVTEGTAWVRCFQQAKGAPTDDQTCASGDTVTIGHRVRASSIVQVGRLHIRVGGTEHDAGIQRTLWGNGGEWRRLHLDAGLLQDENVGMQSPSGSEKSRAPS